jgi:lantibiotic modifying enzyme
MQRPEFLAAANAIGARLCRDAVWAGDRCAWLGDSMEYVENRWQVVHRAFGPDLYAGSSGIGLLLARLFAMTGEPVLRSTAEAAFRHAASRLADIPAPSRAGYHAGLPGVADAMIDAGACLDRPALVEQGLTVAASLAAEDPDTQGIDLLGGSAGAIAPMLRLAARFGRPDLRALADRHAERLLARARIEGDVWHWDTTNGQAAEGLTGLSHGAAGIGWALLEFAVATGDATARRGADGAFAYERSCFNAEHGNWPDLRALYDPMLASSSGGQPMFMTAWCHGAPGVALSRLRAVALTGDATCRTEAEIAVETSARSLSPAAAGAGGSFCLCHGFGGNAEPLLMAADMLGQSAWRMAAEEIGMAGLAAYDGPRLPWPCGVLGGGETPGLMLGLGGVGYFYLRLYDPAVPSVLLPSGP